METLLFPSFPVSNFLSCLQNDTLDATLVKSYLKVLYAVSLFSGSLVSVLFQH